ncbi:MAG: Amidophosphoribosyltransferase [Phycisphaerales bacterium]|nr:Amidophosphoribosyltransferase [Phycisphaerales bacterium]MCK6475726.1 amidophosphoribosyltransferase [Phycisphaerales bacterium]
MHDPIPLPVLRSTPGRGDAHREKKEKCGVVGIWGHPAAARLTYLAMYAQQHRGQESAGIAISDGHALTGFTGMGLVPEIFDSDTLEKLARSGPIAAIGHNRYSTAGGSLSCNAQPLIESYIAGQVGLAHNGNLINAEALRYAYEEAGHIFHTTSDTEVIIHLLASPQQQKSPDPLAATLRRLQGAFSLAFLFPDRIEVARDPWAWRPLVLGYLPAEADETGRPLGKPHEQGYPIVASETVALDVLGAKFIREIEPGEILCISDRGIHSRRFALPAPRLAKCVFEHVYFANPASNVFGQNVQTVREMLGEKLAAEAPVAADCVMPMPDSGRSAAAGYARASGIPYREGIVPNRYVGRTFIKPSQAERAAAVRLKLNVVSDIVAGKKLIVVDDSIVRGTTTKAKMDQLRQAGAKEIHLRISCPPIRHPCYFGVDFATRDQLIAHGREVEEIRRFLGVDSLHYLTLEGMLACVHGEARHWCTACYSGDYRLDPEHPVTDIVADSPQMAMFEQ